MELIHGVPQTGRENVVQTGRGASSNKETDEELRDYVEHYDAVHHTDDLPGSFAAKVVLQEGKPAGVADATSSAGVSEGSTQYSQGRSGPEPPVPGEPQNLTTKALDVARGVVQNFDPIKGIHQHSHAWHFYAHDLSRQVEAHHYCSHLSEEVRQCLLYDSDQKGARLIGVEYMISERLFQELPEDEKKYWHSHRYEVGCGLLIAPHVPDFAERADMQKIISTYGKTWHFWQVDRGDPLPYGPPQLMMSFTGPGQLKPELVEERDRRYGVSTAEKARQRKEKLEWPPGVCPGADHWESGTAWQVSMEEVPVNKEVAHHSRPEL